MSNISTTKPKRKAHNTLTREEFVERAIKKHGLKYGYDDVVYINTITPVSIRCFKHGLYQQKPSNHLQGSGCLRCCGKYKTTETIVEDFIEARGYLYDYSLVSFVKGEKLSIICRKHGVFKQKYWNHLKGQDCPKCCDEVRNNKARFNLDDLVIIFNKIHDYKYDYSESIYVNVDTPIKIKCSEHGFFMQTPWHHKKQGSGCPKCTKVSVYSRSRYIESCNKADGNSSLYIIRMFNENESFYKVGITMKSIKSRFSKSPYKIEEIVIFKSKADIIYDLETQLHRLLKKYSYNPKIKFGGSATECFVKIPKSILKLVSDMDKSNQLQLMA